MRVWIRMITLLVDVAKPLVIKKLVDIEKDVEVEQVEVKVEVEAEERDTEKLVKGEKIHVEVLKFTQGPINLASLSPI